MSQMNTYMRTHEEPLTPSPLVLKSSKEKRTFKFSKFNEPLPALSFFYLCPQFFASYPPTFP